MPCCCHGRITGLLKSLKGIFLASTTKCHTCLLMCQPNQTCTVVEGCQVTDDLGGVMEDRAGIWALWSYVGNPVWSCLEMYAQPIRHEMAVTLTLYLSKQSSSVFMNSNELWFFASDMQTGSCEIQSILFVSLETCILIVEVVKEGSISWIIHLKKKIAYTKLTSLTK